MICAALPAAAASLQATDESRRITVILRYDDCSAVSPTDIELRVLESVRRHGLNCVFAAIPQVHVHDSGYKGVQAAQGADEQENCAEEVTDVRPLPQEKSALLREFVRSGTLEIAQHGYEHRRLQNASVRGGNTELFGRGLELQRQMLASGKAALEEWSGRKVTSFVPPFNSYDNDTLAVLEELGFLNFSAGMLDAVPEYCKLSVLPHTCNLLQLKDAVARARVSSSAQPMVMPLFHPFDFTEYDSRKGCISLDEFDSLMAWLAAQHDVDVVTMQQATTQGKNGTMTGNAVQTDASAVSLYDVTRHMAHRCFMLFSLHPRVAASAVPVGARLVLPQPEEAAFLRLRLLLATIAGYLVAFVMGLVAGRLSGTQTLFEPQWVAGILIVVAGLWCLMLLRRRSEIYYNAARLTVFFFSCIAGVLL
ncbi:DUF2334 domain-containing protein [Oleidesulfovibrio sp.]|uniref:DUF2334 domain-containing protein n=1 Tax=Oleidesulfovibrio sp. TaxID=2909707 RepID=UPI003A8A8996